MAKDITTEKLAQMIQKGFESQDKKIESVKNELKNELKKTQAVLRLELEDISSKLNNVVYRFEFEDLEKRVIKLERKFSMAK